MGKAECNRRYQTSENGRKMTRQAIKRYIMKNRDNAINCGEKYTAEDISVIESIDRGKVTISQVAVKLGRSNSAIIGKLYRIRRNRTT